ncbi:MAG: hypothetical protein HOE90_18605, partial [Bacteriovoracaceae bacterium]|nr:hypothetical protein [Bacteriovoracaceae bacterium]
IALTKLNWTGSSVDVLADVDTTTSAPTNGQVLKWNNGASKWEPAADSDTVSALGASIETGEITDGTIDNADVNAAAAIAWTKISKTGASVDDLPDVDTTTSAPTNGQVLKWNNGASKWEPANDSDTVSTLGASIETGEITDGTIANADINAGAAIAWGKIDKAGAGAADVGAAPAGRNLAAGAGLTGGGTLAADRVFNVNVDGATMEVNADAIRVKDGGITNAKLSTGSVGSLKINNGSILDIDINAGAAINWGKISKVGSTVDHIADVDTTTVAPTNGQVLKWNNGASKWEPANDSDTGLALGTSIETGEITNGTIANVDINAAAAIAWTKISKAGAVPADIGAAVGTTTMTAGAGLTGGGDLTNNRTFNVNPDGLSLEINADQVRIKALGVTTALIANANVTNAKITNNAVNSVKISDGSVTGADIAVDTITAVDVAADAIGSSELQNNSVGVNEIVTNGVGSAEVVDNSLTATDLAANSVTASEIATGAVGSAEVVDNSLTATDLAANSVTASEIAADAVGASEIATGAVGTSEIATNGVGAAEIAANAVGSSEMNFAHADFKQVLSAGINFTGTTVTKLSECGSTYIATGGSCQVTGCGQWELVYSGWGDTTNKDNWKCQAKRKGGTSTCTLKARVICLLQ